MTRQEAIEKIINGFCNLRVWCELYPDNCQKEDCEMWWAIEALSSEATQEWIPCSERLPETGKDVLVTRAYDGRDDGIKSTVYVEVSACFANGDEWHGFSDEYKMNPQNHTVIAWMPLPKPYKGGDEA